MVSIHLKPSQCKKPTTTKQPRAQNTKLKMVSSELKMPPMWRVPPKGNRQHLGTGWTLELSLGVWSDMSRWAITPPVCQLSEPICKWCGQVESLVPTDCCPQQASVIEPFLIKWQTSELKKRLCWRGKETILNCCKRTKQWRRDPWHGRSIYEIT